MLASGRIGRSKSGYGTIVGQANGQGGREHGQKCDQLPGWRDISNPEHRRYIAGVWGIDEKEIPGPGVDAYELFRKIDAGEIKALLAICFNPKISLPDSEFVTRALEKLEFFAVIDFFLNDTARHADIVLPGSLHEEDEGTVTQVEGRVIKINKAVDCPGEARQDWIIIQDLARALGRPHGFTFGSPREIFEELRVASKGGVADYSGITYEKIERQMGVFWPCYDVDPKSGAPSPDHPGTPRLFESDSYNPVAKGAGPFYFPGWQGALQRRRVPRTRRRRVPRFSDLPDDGPRGESISLGDADAPDWTSRRPVPGAAHRAPSTPCRKARDRGWRLDDLRDAPRRRSPFAPWSSRPSGPILSSFPIIGRDRRAPIGSPSPPRTRSARSRNTRSADVAFAEPRASRNTHANWRRNNERTEPPRVLRRSEPVHRLPGVRAGLLRMRHSQGRIDDPPRVRRSRALRANGAGGLHALRTADLRRGLSRRCHQAHGRRRRAERAQTALHRLRELRDGLSVRRAGSCISIARS